MIMISNLFKVIQTERKLLSLIPNELLSTFAGAKSFNFDKFSLRKKLWG